MEPIEPVFTFTVKMLLQVANRIAAIGDKANALPLGKAL